MATTTSSARTHGQQQRQPDPLRRMRGLDAKSALRASPRTVTTAATAALLVPLGAALLGASGLALAATLTAGAALVAPLLVVFSPVLVPSALAAALTAAGLLASGALGVAGVSALAWAAGYVWRWRREAAGVTGMVAQPLDHGSKRRHGVEGGAAAFVGHRHLPRDIDVASA